MAASSSTSSTRLGVGLGMAGAAGETPAATTGAGVTAAARAGARPNKVFGPRELGGGAGVGAAGAGTALGGASATAVARVAEPLNLQRKESKRLMAEGSMWLRKMARTPLGQVGSAAEFWAISRTRHVPIVIGESRGC